MIFIINIDTVNLHIRNRQHGPGTIFYSCTYEPKYWDMLRETMKQIEREEYVSGMQHKLAFGIVLLTIAAVALAIYGIIYWLVY